jgi:hypothetical protein
VISPRLTTLSISSKGEFSNIFLYLLKISEKNYSKHFLPCIIIVKEVSILVAFKAEVSI